MFSFLMAVAVTVLACALVMPDYRKRLLSNVGWNVEPGTDDAKVQTAVLTVATVFIAYWAFGTFWTVVGAIALLAYTHKGDTDSITGWLVAWYKQNFSSDTPTTRPTPPTPPRRPQPPTGSDDNGTGAWLERERDLNQPGGRRPPPVVNIPRPVPPHREVPEPNMGDILDSEDRINNPGGNANANDPHQDPGLLCSGDGPPDQEPRTTTVQPLLPPPAAPPTDPWRQDEVPEWRK